MNLFKLMLTAGPLKSFAAKWIKNTIFLKTGYHVDISLNDICFKEENGKVSLKLNTDLNMNSEEFYKLLDKFAN